MLRKTTQSTHLPAAAPAVAAPLRRSPRAALATLGSLSMLAVLAFAVAVPAQAEVFHVKLRNGTVVDTAYQPQQAPWDASLVVFLDESGNWIGLPQKDIETVQSESQLRGFGVSLNFNTVAIGWAPNDAIDPATAKTDPNAATMQALQNIYSQQQEQAHYSVQQFVNAEQTTSTSGIPSAFIGGGRVPQVTPPPAPPPVVLQAAPAGGAGPSGGAAPPS